MSEKEMLKELFQDREETLKKLFQYREGLEANIKILEEEGDDRYPKSFIDGMVAGLRQAMGACDATARLIKREEAKGEKENE